MSRNVHGCTSVAEDMDVRERLGQGCPRETAAQDVRIGLRTFTDYAIASSVLTRMADVDVNVTCN